jgi:hypothetical protein
MTLVSFWIECCFVMQINKITEMFIIQFYIAQYRPQLIKGLGSPLWYYDPMWAMVSSFLRFPYRTQRRTTVGRTPLDDWSAGRRDERIWKLNVNTALFYGYNFITFAYDDNTANYGEGKHVNTFQNKEDHQSCTEKNIILRHTL